MKEFAHMVGFFLTSPLFCWLLPCLPRHRSRRRQSYWRHVSVSIMCTTRWVCPHSCSRDDSNLISVRRLPSPPPPPPTPSLPSSLPSSYAHPPPTPVDVISSTHLGKLGRYQIFKHTSPTVLWMYYVISSWASIVSGLIWYLPHLMVRYDWIFKVKE